MLHISIVCTWADDEIDFETTTIVRKEDGWNRGENKKKCSGKLQSVTTHSAT